MMKFKRLANKQLYLINTMSWNDIDEVLNLYYYSTRLKFAGQVTWPKIENVPVPIGAELDLKLSLFFLRTTKNVYWFKFQVLN